MRGKAKSVLVSLLAEKRYAEVMPFVSFTRLNSCDTRSFYNVTEKQIDRVRRVVKHMVADGQLEIYLHNWGWAGCREGLI